VPVALVGKVFCKVDADFGAIAAQVKAKI